VRVAARTADGVFVIDLELEEVLDIDADVVEPPRPHVELPRLVAAASSGSTVVAVLDRRPPLAVSHDAGRTWRESGGGLPAGVAVAIDDDNPDRIVYAARNRLYVSDDGGRFWRALAPELPAIEAVAFVP
jgi:hypothetical protein